MPYIKPASFSEKTVRIKYYFDTARMHGASDFERYLQRDADLQQLQKRLAKLPHKDYKDVMQSIDSLLGAFERANSIPTEKKSNSTTKDKAVEKQVKKEADQLLQQKK